MSTTDTKITGKKIHELDPLTQLKNEAWLATSQDTITRKFPARMIRTFINGDIDEPSNESYYSTVKTNSLLKTIKDRIADVEASVVAANVRIDNLSTTVLENYNTLDNRITAEVNKLTTRINTEVKTINDRITTVYNELVAADSALKTRCTALETRSTALETRCATIEQSITNLNTKLEGWILYGNAAPTGAIPAGRLYIQWF